MNRGARAVEAMIVHALPLLGAGTAGHLIGNVTTAYLLEPDAEDLPPFLDALRDRVALDRRFSAERPDYGAKYPAGLEVVDKLLVSLAAIWHDALEGTDVTPDSLEKLTAVVDAVGRDLYLRRVSGVWAVEIRCARTPAQRMPARVLASASHTYLCVAAELVLLALEEASAKGTNAG